MYTIGVEFDWDSHNRKHVARHRVTPEEAEQVIRNDPLVVQFQDHAAEERMLCLGQTNRGRLLAVVYTERNRAIRVVTTYPMTPRQEEFYLRKR